MSPVYTQTVVCAPIGETDHNVVLCSPTIRARVMGRTQYKATRVVGPNEKAMFALVLRRLQWQQLYHLPTCHEQFHMLQTTLQELIESHFPTRIMEPYTKDKAWVSEHFKNTLRKCQEAWHRGDQREFRKQRNLVNWLSASFCKSFFQKEMSRAKSGSGHSG